MKTSTAGTVTGFLLILMAGIGFGIAHADGTETDRSLYDSPYYDQLTVTNAPEEDMDLRGPIAAGTLPSETKERVDDYDNLDLGRE